MYTPQVMVIQVLEDEVFRGFHMMFRLFIRGIFYVFLLLEKNMDHILGDFHIIFVIVVKSPKKSLFDHCP